MTKAVKNKLCLLLAVALLLALGGCAAQGAGGGTVSTQGTVIPQGTENTGETTAPEPTQESTEPTGTGPIETTPSEPTDNTTPATEPDNTTQTQKPPVENHTHSYTESVVKPTCESKGYTLHKCSCGDSYKDTETAALGHSYTEKVIAPTTENKGYTEHLCGSCGDSYKDNYTDKLPAACQHNWKSTYYPEVGHYTDYYIVCKCGFRCQFEYEWGAHVEANLSEAAEKHTNWGSVRDYIVDSPGRWEWTCTKCGAVTDTKP